MRQRSAVQKRRLHLLWRQTALYGTLIAGLLFVLVMAWGMWRGDLAPVFDAEFKVVPTEAAEVLAIPCPVEPATEHPQPSGVVVRVLNGSGRTGYAAAAATALAAYGFVEPSAGNAASYDGVVKLVTGINGVNGAYTLYQYVPAGAVIVLDTREDATVDLILGLQYDAIKSVDEVSYDPASPIQALEGCREASSLLAELPAPASSPSLSPAE
ncbi:MAG: LytR C-terminal domain-containing protein [Bifidobacteriaceae bacterium]|jgi:hypothetical protein|nr:LytR C-terminal domain-containing protein [Bifidobacteriaceae bacterium]